MNFTRADPCVATTRVSPFYLYATQKTNMVTDCESMTMHNLINMNQLHEQTNKFGGGMQSHSDCK
jgi:hypothetical protein